MTDLDEILNGLAEALELERELGVRVVEFDRALLTGREEGREEGRGQRSRSTAVAEAVSAEGVRRETRDASREGRAPARPQVARREARDAASEGARREARDAASEGARREARDAGAEGVRRETALASRLTPHDLPPRVSSSSSHPLPLVFLHDRALSPSGVEMMAKIVTAMHQTPETAPILFTGTRPAAVVTVVLGHRALRAWFPGAAGAPGQWISPDGISNVLVTYSPEYILRFGAETPAVRKLKLEMWTSLKAAIQRIASAS